MKALVVSPVTLAGTTYNAGELVEVDSISFGNLVRKGKLALPTEDAPKPSRAPSKRVVAEPK